MSTTRMCNWAPTPLSSPRHSLLALAAGLSAGLSASAAQPPDLHTLVVTGQPAPGAPAGVVFEFVSSPRINDAGAVAFWARLGGPAAADPKVGSIWTLAPGGSPVLAVQAGDATPFDATYHFIAPVDPALDAQGGLTFLSSFSNVPVPTHYTPAPAGLFAAAAGSTSDLGARDGAAAPFPIPFTDPTFFSVLTASTGAPGTVTFTGSIAAPGGLAATGWGLWSASAGGVVPIAARGQQAPGLAEGVLLFHLDAPPQGALGSLIFRSTLQGGGTVVNQDQALWTDRTGTVALLAVHGDAAPGATDATFADFGTQPVLDASGRATFAVRLAGDGVTADTDTGLWTDRAGSLAPLAREGDAAPGTPAGTLFASISPRPGVNDLSDAAFTATLRAGDTTPDNNSGLWLSRTGGAPQLIAREGDQVGGMPVGVRFAILHEPAINSRNQLVFLARLRGDEGAGVTPASNFALLASDRCGNITPIARTGSPFTVTPPGGAPAERIVADIVYDNGSQDAGRAQLNNTGALVFTLRFTDGTSGLFSAATFARADINRDTAVNSSDISAFLTIWLASVTAPNLVADFNEDGVTNSSDISAFLTAWLAELTGGC